jgi:hypothetical protein
MSSGDKQWKRDRVVAADDKAETLTAVEGVRGLAVVDAWGRERG